MTSYEQPMVMFLGSRVAREDSGRWCRLDFDDEQVVKEEEAWKKRTC
jgi:hypothetical protein